MVIPDLFIIIIIIIGINPLYKGSSLSISHYTSSLINIKILIRIMLVQVYESKDYLISNSCDKSHYSTYNYITILYPLYKTKEAIKVVETQSASYFLFLNHSKHCNPRLKTLIIMTLMFCFFCMTPSLDKPL